MPTHELDRQINAARAAGAGNAPTVEEVNLVDDRLDVGKLLAEIVEMKPVDACAPIVKQPGAGKHEAAGAQAY